jgi:sialate O-acetylesterase
MKVFFSAGLLSFTALLLPNAARGNIQMPAIFGDHMVLQQSTTLPFWGKADPGEEVTVAIGSNQAKATADASGLWRVDLHPLPVTQTPVQVQVTGKNTLTFSDVLVGDVWLCSGQSNMEFGIGKAGNAAQVIPQLNYPAIRMFLVAHTIAFDPQTDVKVDDLTDPAVKTMRGHWVVCTPENVVKIGGWNGFSAAALFFAREIFEDRKQPIGLIGAYWGGTQVKDWMSLDSLEQDPACASFVTEFNTTKANWATMLDTFKTQTFPKWQQDHDAWKQQVAQLAPGSPKPKEPKRPEAPDAYPQFPVILFDGMINPLIPYALKGVLWYQGESNGSTEADRHGLYGKMFADMITDWRKRWGEGDFPFLFVQASTWNQGYFWISIRDQQLKTLALPNTGMAVTMDLGAENDPHYLDKEDVGHRLALAARHVAYGENLVYSGPIYSSSTVEGNEIRIHFTNTGSGLKIGTAPAAVYPNGQVPPPEDHLTGFEISNFANLFSPAQAKIDGDTVLVWNDSIPKPKDVRYGNAGFPKPLLNLYNNENLPASPFSTVKPKPLVLPAANTAASPP